MFHFFEQRSRPSIDAIQGRVARPGLDTTAPQPITASSPAVAADGYSKGKSGWQPGFFIVPRASSARVRLHLCPYDFAGMPRRKPPGA